MPKVIGKLKTDFFSNQKLKFDAFKSQMEKIEQSLKEMDISDAEKDSAELHKIAKFDVTSVSTICFTEHKNGDNNE